MSKKIEKLNDWDFNTSDELIGFSEVKKHIKPTEENMDKFMKKINEIIDKLNSRQ